MDLHDMIAQMKRFHNQATEAEVEMLEAHAQTMQASITRRHVILKNVPLMVDVRDGSGFEMHL